MGLKELLDASQLRVAAEKMARASWEHVLYPAAAKLIKSTENKWDDAALALAKELIEEAIDSISPEEK